MPTPIPPAAYPIYIQLINITYQDRIEQLLSAQLQDDGDTVIALGQDGIKRIAFKITSEAIEFKLQPPAQEPTESIDPATLPSLDDVAATFARKGRKGKGKKNCEKGLNCGGTCISKKKTCLKDMSPEQKALHKKVKKAAGGGGGATEEETLAPTPLTVDDRIKLGELPPPRRKGSPKDELFEKIDIGDGDFVSIEFSFNDDEKDLNQLSIAFSINGRYSADGGAISDRKAVRAGKVAGDALKAKFKGMPNGQILANSPEDRDGKGEARKRLYAKAGFGPLDPSTKNMYAVLKDGKLLPLADYNEAKAYFDSKAKAPTKRRSET